MDSCVLEPSGSNGCGCEPCQVNKLQADIISSLKREATLSRDLGRVKAENVELNSKLASVKESLQKAKSSTRVALVDMAEQNAKLVAAYVEKKREVKQLQRGNRLYQAQHYQQALEAYSAALAISHSDRSFKAVVLCNRAAALHSCGQYLDAIADCCAAAELDCNYPRALQRRADAYLALEDYSSAIADLKRLMELGGHSKETTLKLKEAQQKLQGAVYSSTTAEVGAAGVKGIPNHYLVLGLQQQSASAADVKAAYK
eukprot:gene3705-3968_t